MDRFFLTRWKRSETEVVEEECYSISSTAAALARLVANIDSDAGDVSAMPI